MELAEHLSAIAVALAALVAILVGGRQFAETQRLTRETQAVELLIKFNELSVNRDAEDEDRAFWTNNARLTITESIHHLTVRNKSWEATVLWMLGTQTDFLTSRRLVCSTYSPSFMDILKQSGIPFKCVEAESSAGT